MGFLDYLFFFFSAWSFWHSGQPQCWIDCPRMFIALACLCLKTPLLLAVQLRFHFSMVARNIESIEHSSVAPIRSHMYFSGLCLLHLLLVWTDYSFVHAWIKRKKGVECKGWRGTGSWGYERERWWWSDDRGRKGRPWFEAIAHVCVHVASFCLASFSLVCARPFLVSSACSSGSNIGACVRVLCAKDKLGMMDERSWGTPVCRYGKWRPPSLHPWWVHGSPRCVKVLEDVLLLLLALVVHIV